MSSTQAIGNNAGVAVPLAVDGSGNLRAVASTAAPIAANVFDSSAWRPLLATATGRVNVVLVGTTNTGTLVPVQVLSTGALVTV
jgi:hypothetical protein